jgi:hypothetical protein
MSTKRGLTGAGTWRNNVMSWSSSTVSGSDADDAMSCPLARQSTPERTDARLGCTHHAKRVYYPSLSDGRYQRFLDKTCQN